MIVPLHVVLAAAAAVAVAAEDARGDGSGVAGDCEPRPAAIPGRNQDDEKLNFLSATLGSHMVLQRAPQQAVVWGHTAPGAKVTTMMTKVGREEDTALKLVTTAAADGTWRQLLPATAASKEPYSFQFSSSSAAEEKATMTDVLFGDVFLCGGDQYFAAQSFCLYICAEFSACDLHLHSLSPSLRTACRNVRSVKHGIRHASCCEPHHRAARSQQFPDDPLLFSRPPNSISHATKRPSNGPAH